MGRRSEGAGGVTGERVIRPDGAHDNAVLNAQLIELIGHFGAHSRNIARAALETEEGGAKE
ncbi:hypothetical protein M770_22100 [Pseudomonas aeruginosa VRFPA03]|nr:hypothetical protein M770_22100 [Pseudomonas aeruginosa VRFPA03]